MAMWPSARAEDSESAGKRVARGVSDTLTAAARDWHTPWCNDSEKRGEIAADPRNGLVQQAQHWAGPQARDHFPPHTPERIAAMKAEGHGMRNLNDEASNWPAPANRDYRGSSEGSVTRRDGKSRADMLDYAAEQFFRPPSSPDQPIAGGAMSSTDGPSSNQPSVRRKLNPIFVEALMRWPTGLSAFERQETAWTRWWLLMPSFVSALCSQKPADQGQLL
jgi:hypothetical protein